MDNTYVEWRKRENIRSMDLSDKQQYYLDLLNIEHSWTGRIDGNICNTFIMEAEQQLVNAIELFEQGYFDCAYYSLRSAVDLSTTMVFLVDMPDDEKEQYLKAWKSTADFPMQGQLIKQLSQSGSIFADMKAKMPGFFIDAKKLCAEINKYVHKQGLQHFYISRNHPINQNKPQEPFVQSFNSYLERCIGIVAVMRLAVDPFPILLMDQEILYRCFDTLTEPYSEDFVSKYIGETLIEQYKQTDQYKGTYDAFLSEEKKTEAVFNVMKHQYIDTNKLKEILEQFHLLPKDDVICVLLVSACEKVVKVYTANGFMMYFTDRKTNREALSWCGVDFMRFSQAKISTNMTYDEAYISVLHFDNSPYFLEHNIPLTVEEVKKLSEYVSSFLSKDKLQHKA